MSQNMKIDLNLYYDAKYVQTCDPEFFIGCKTIRAVIEKCNIDEPDYAFGWKYSAHNYWTKVERTNTRATLFLKKDWVSEFVPYFQETIEEKKENIQNIEEQKKQIIENKKIIDDQNKQIIDNKKIIDNQIKQIIKNKKIIENFDMDDKNYSDSDSDCDRDNDSDIDNSDNDNNNKKDKTETNIIKKTNNTYNYYVYPDDYNKKMYERDAENEESLMLDINKFIGACLVKKRGIDIHSDKNAYYEEFNYNRHKYDELLNKYYYMCNYVSNKYIDFNTSEYKMPTIDKNYKVHKLDDEGEKDTSKINDCIDKMLFNISRVELKLKLDTNYEKLKIEEYYDRYDYNWAEYITIIKNSSTIFFKMSDLIEFCSNRTKYLKNIISNTIIWASLVLHEEHLDINKCDKYFILDKDYVIINYNGSEERYLTTIGSIKFFSLFGFNNNRKYLQFDWHLFLLQCFKYINDANECHNIIYLIKSHNTFSQISKSNINGKMYIVKQLGTVRELRNNLQITGYDDDDIVLRYGVVSDMNKYLDHEYINYKWLKTKPNIISCFIANDDCGVKTNVDIDISLSNFFSMYSELINPTIIRGAVVLEKRRLRDVLILFDHLNNMYGFGDSHNNLLKLTLWKEEQLWRPI